ncbi:MAG: metallothionein [Cyanobacteria bacterium J06623_7]
MASASSIKCGCDRCSCEISLEKAVQKNGKYYCCDACANGHQNDASCKMSGCSCS